MATVALWSFLSLGFALQFVSATTCLDSCRDIDTVFEKTCSSYPRETSEICHGSRSAWIQRCCIQCAALDTPEFSAAKAACGINCNTVVNQIFVTYCQSYPFGTSHICYDNMDMYSKTCFVQCTLL
jgi:hypothetical protein